jgi:hypothetical protein
MGMYFSLVNKIHGKGTKIKKGCPVSGASISKSWKKMQLSAADGTFSAEYGIGKLKTAYLARMYGKEAIDAMKRIKSALDPALATEQGQPVRIRCCTRLSCLIFISFSLFFLSSISAGFYCSCFVYIRISYYMFI